MRASASGSALAPVAPRPRSGSCERALQDRHQIGLGERAEHVDATAGEERAVDLERRVLGGGADQHDGALLDVGQEGVLLRPVEAVDLVHEQDRALAAPAALGLRLGHHLADLLHARHHRRERHEAGARHVGQEPRQRGLAGAGRAPEDHGVELALLEGPAQRLARRGQLRLADDLVEGLRAHAVGERRGRLRGGGRRRVEQVHARIIRARGYASAAGRSSREWISAAMTTPRCSISARSGR